MTELFREVDEDLRHERYAKLWRRYGLYLVAAAIAIIVLTAAVVGWRNHRASREVQQGEAFTQAMNLVAAGDTQGAITAFAALTQDADPGYRTLAGFAQAAALIEQGDPAGAVRIYNTLTKTAVNQTFRDLAVILSATHSLDSADPAELKKQLTPLTDIENPWRYSALELSGLLARRTGDTEREREVFTQLSEDPAAPVGIRSRAAEMLQTLGG